MKLTPRSGSEGPGLSYVTSQNYYKDPNYRVVGNTNYEGSYSYRTFVGQDIDDFHKRKKRGELLPFTYFSQYEAEGSASGESHYTVLSTGYEGGGTEFNPHPKTNHPDWKISKTELEAYAANQDFTPALQSCAAKVYSKGWDALTWAVELNKTALLFSKTASRFLYYARKGQIEKMWLEGRYGWRLLMYDIQDISKVLSGIGNNFLRVKDRAGFSSSSSESATAGVVWSSQTYDVVTSTTWSNSIRGSIVADITPPEIAINPITTSWEVIPFSFVVDWFINVGTTLEAISFLLLQTNYVAAGGTYTSATRTSIITNVTPKPGYGTCNTNFSSSYTASLTQRVPTSVSLVPQVRLNLDTLKVMDLVALIIQALRR